MEDEVLLRKQLSAFLENLGAEVQMMMRFKDSPQPPQGGECGNAPGDKIMHASLETDSGFTLMASDLPPHMEHKPGNNISVSIEPFARLSRTVRAAAAEEAERLAAFLGVELGKLS